MTALKLWWIFPQFRYIWYSIVDNYSWAGLKCSFNILGIKCKNFLKEGGKYTNKWVWNTGGISYSHSKKPIFKKAKFRLQYCLYNGSRYSDKINHSNEWTDLWQYIHILHAQLFWVTGFGPQGLNNYWILQIVSIIRIKPVKYSIYFLLKWT